MKKAKWLIQVTYVDGLNITQRVSVPEISKFVKKSKLKYEFSAEIIQKYVYPFAQKTLANQKTAIKDIIITEIK